MEDEILGKKEVLMLQQKQPSEKETNGELVSGAY